MSLTVRSFQPGDAEAVIALWRDSDLTRPWNDPAHDIARKLRVQPELFVVGEHEGKIIASVMAGYEGHRGWVNYLAVDPGHRKRGVARALMAHVEGALAALGCPKLNLQVRAENVAARAFYERLGYLHEARESYGKPLAQAKASPAAEDAGVRALVDADLPALLALYAQLDPRDPPLSEAVASATWRRILADPALIYLGSFEQGRLVSTCHAAVVVNLTRGARPYAVIENVVTDARVRRRGHGRRTLEALLARCWQAGCYKVMLASGAHRTDAHAFYTSLGFDAEAKQSFVISRARSPQQG